MLRITKLTDYAIVLLSELDVSSGSACSARDLAERTRIPQPTVSKVLNRLSRGRLVVADRGVKGGYRLVRARSAVSLADVIDAVEGPIAVTECTTGDSSCELEGHCRVGASWLRVNDVVRRALGGVSLAEMTRPLRVGGLVTLRASRPIPAAHGKCTDGAGDER